MRRGWLVAGAMLLSMSVWGEGAGKDAAAGCAALRVPETMERTAGFARMDATVREGLGSHYAGAVLVVAYRGRVVHETAFGEAQSLTVDGGGRVVPLAPARRMEIDSIFDMASVTKVEATTAAVMHLVDEGKLHLDDRLGALLPEFAGGDKAGITVRQLLTHRAGLQEWQPVWLYRGQPGGVVQYLAGLPLENPIGAKWAYSDLGFMLLGEIVARRTGEALDAYVQREIYRPLGMKDTGFRPAEGLRGRIVASSEGDLYQRAMAETGKPYPVLEKVPMGVKPVYRRQFLVGEANDANSWLGWDGVAGHAGLFSTALDLARYAQALENGGCAGGFRLASEATVRQFEETPYDATQALGFRKFHFEGLNEPFYGHTGFTGTAFWFSPRLQLTVVLLTNRLHRKELPGEEYPSLTAIRAAVAREAVEAVGAR